MTSLRSEIGIDRDGRVLHACRWGRGGALGVVGFHGTPGTRHSAVPDDDVLNSLGIDYLTYDRPGYGDSTRQAGRTLEDCVGDAAAIADAVGLARFAVVGGSGGAPHALACAALLPDRVVAVSLVVPVGSVREMGQDAYFAGMNDENTTLFRAALGGAGAVEPLILDAVRRQGVTATPAEVAGMVDDLVAIHSPWGFTPAEVGAPVDVWYGRDDTSTPAGHARWLESTLPRPASHAQDGDHSWPARRLPEIFRGLVALAG